MHGHVSAFRKPHPHLPSHSGTSPKRKNSSTNRRRPGTRADGSGDSAHAQTSDLDLPAFDRLPIRPELQRPDSVITTSSVVSSEATSVIEEVETETEEKMSVPAPTPATVYTISGLYGSEVAGGGESADDAGPNSGQVRDGRMVSFITFEMTKSFS